MCWNEDCYCSYSNKVTFRERTGHRGKFWGSTLNWENTSMGFCQITEKTYCSGYKNIIFTVNLNLTMFLFNPFYIYIFVFVLWDVKWKKRNSKNRLKFGFHCTRYSVRLFFCQHCVMGNHEIDWINDSWSPNNNALLGMCLCVCIQGVSWLEDIAAGGYFLGLCDQKSSYKHVSDFGPLRSYGHF